MFSCNGCGRISKTRLCDTCRAARPKRPNFRQRGYGKVYEQNRKIRLAVDPRCTCQGCDSCDGKPCTRKANTADHIVRKRDGGTDHYSNLRSMCGPCHSCHTAKESPGGWNRR